MGRDVFRRISPSDAAGVLVAPSILSADFARLGEQCRAALDAGGDLLHLDVMDGHFVPNLTMGPALCRSLRAALVDVSLDVHLMVADPMLHLEPFAEAGADHCTVHIEACERADVKPADAARRMHELGMSAGLAINPPTNVSRLLPHVDDFDVILVMSVIPGFAGQQFMEVSLETAATVHNVLREDQRLEMDGGINPQTAPRCLEAGCSVLVAASAIFRSDDYQAAIAALRGGQRSPLAEPAG